MIYKKVLSKNGEESAFQNAKSSVTNTYRPRTVALESAMNETATVHCIPCHCIEEWCEFFVECDLITGRFHFAIVACLHGTEIDCLLLDGHIEADQCGTIQRVHRLFATLCAAMLNPYIGYSIASEICSFPFVAFF